MATETPTEVTTEGQSPAPREISTGRSALLIAVGIFLSRVIGIVRQRFFAHYFGISVAGDAFSAAFRIPNLLQNLFGEGVLSASFIPVYSRLLAEGDEEEAGRVAGAIFALLLLVVSALVLLGVVATPLLIDLIAPGFTDEKRALTVELVRVLFPGAGLLVLSAWCLGVLNSHRRFFLSYAAPVIWNVAMIATLVALGGRTAQFRLAWALAWGSVIGSALQFAVQLPTVFRVARRLRFSFGVKSSAVRTVARNFLPAFFSRGVVQISAYIDTGIASLLGDGAMTGITNAQVIYTLPVSLFGMSISAAELPAMSSVTGSRQEIAAQLRRRLDGGLRRVAFYIVPSAVALFALGDVIAGAIYQTGRFVRDDTVYVWVILAGSSVGLLASTLGRLYSSAYYALHDTRTPLRFAVVRLVCVVLLGYSLAVLLPPALSLDSRWGVVGLTLSSSVAGWTEFALLRRSLNRRIGRTGMSASYAAKLWAAAIFAAGAGWGVKLAFAGALHPIPQAVFVLGVYGSLYFAGAGLLKIPEAETVLNKILRKVRRR